MAQHSWPCVPLKSVSSATVQSKVVMPKQRFPLRVPWRKNHAAWERNLEALLALGTKLAWWMVLGIVKVFPGFQLVVHFPSLSSPFKLGLWTRRQTLLVPDPWLLQLECLP